MTVGSDNMVFEKIKIYYLVDDDLVVWFNSLNIANALGYKNTKKAIQNNVHKNDKIILYKIKSQNKNKSHGHHQTVYINESGLYSLLLSSKKPNAKTFKHWITSDVLPQIRRKNIKNIKQKYIKNISELIKKVDLLEKSNKVLNNDLKKDKFPKGAMVYVIDYSNDVDKNVFRIGVTCDMKKRKQVYDTHTLHKHKVVYYLVHDCAQQLETCVRSLLHKYRYKNKKDFFIVGIDVIRRVFKKCSDGIKCVEKMKGGMKYNNDDLIDIMNDHIVDTIKKYYLL